MSEPEMADIVAFLKALTDPDFDRSIPARGHYRKALTIKTPNPR